MNSLQKPIDSFILLQTEGLRSVFAAQNLQENATALAQEYAKLQALAINAPCLRVHQDLQH